MFPEALTDIKLIHGLSAAPINRLFFLPKTTLNTLPRTLPNPQKPPETPGAGEITSNSQGQAGQRVALGAAGCQAGRVSAAHLVLEDRAVHYAVVVVQTHP